MKKVLLTSAAVLAAAALAVPAFAEINGGANKPGPYDSAAAYENQTEFVSARTVESYLNGHPENLNGPAAEAAAKDPAVMAAKAEFDAVEGGSHLYGEKKDAYTKAYTDAYNKAYHEVRNAATEHNQNVQNSAKKAEGNYYILNETPEQKNARYNQEHGVTDPSTMEETPMSNGNTAPSAQQTANAQAAAAQAKAAESKTKAAAKTDAKKELPKTHAVK